jgi:hypothetical protein
MKHWSWVAIILLGFAPAAGGAEVDLLNEELREKELPANEPIDFTSLRKRADAMAARQDSSFKLHQVEVDFEFPNSTPRIGHVDFHYFRPAPSRGRPGWEELSLGVAVTVKYGYKSPGRISGGRQLFDDPRPSPAPANIIAPEEALRRLNRGPLAPLHSLPNLPKDPGRWTLSVQLIQLGAKYWAGNVGRSPNLGVHTGHNGLYTEEPFFVKTAPRGTWVWWTVTQHVVPGTRLEYIYIDAVTGKISSHCAEQSAAHTPLVPVPCAPPR